MPPMHSFQLCIVRWCDFYAFSGLLLSSTWRQGLELFGDCTLTPASAHSLYAKTQIGKYLPGNVFHLAGRHVVAKKRGCGHGPLVGASICEVLGLLGASTFIASIGLVICESTSTGIHALATSTFILVCTVALVGPRMANRFCKWMPAPAKADTVRRTIAIHSQYVAFFLISGGLLLAIAHSSIDIRSAETATCVVIAFSLAWATGFVSPGVSGGLGVREAALVFLLAPPFGAQDVILVGILMRVVTTLGDLVFFLIGIVLARRVTTT